MAKLTSSQFNPVCDLSSAELADCIGGDFSNPYIVGGTATGIVIQGSGLLAPALNAALNAWTPPTAGWAQFQQSALNPGLGITYLFGP